MDLKDSLSIRGRGSYLRSREVLTEGPSYGFSVSEGSGAKTDDLKGLKPTCETTNYFITELSHTIQNLRLTHKIPVTIISCTSKVDGSQALKEYYLIHLEVWWSGSSAKHSYWKCN